MVIWFFYNEKDALLDHATPSTFLNVSSVLHSLL
jgi:hypothetical protein